MLGRAHACAAIALLLPLTRAPVLHDVWQVASYYPEPIFEMKHPAVRQALHAQWEEEMNQNRKLGKGPPPKGQGKRSSRKK